MTLTFRANRACTLDGHWWEGHPHGRCFDARDDGGSADDDILGEEGLLVDDAHERECVERGVCPGRKPKFLAVKRPARPFKSTIQNRFA